MDRRTMQQQVAVWSPMDRVTYIGEQQPRCGIYVRRMPDTVPISQSDVRHLWNGMERIYFAPAQYMLYVNTVVAAPSDSACNYYTTLHSWHACRPTRVRTTVPVLVVCLADDRSISASEQFQQTVSMLHMQPCRTGTPLMSSLLYPSLKPGFHSNAIACVSCVA